MDQEPTTKGLGASTRDIRIVLIEDDETIRNSYTYLLNNSNGFLLVNSYSSAEAAIRNIEKDNPHVFLLDIYLAGMSGIDAIADIKTRAPHSFILMLTVFEDPDMILSALSKGASGYLTKNYPMKMITAAIREVISGGGPMSPTVARHVIHSFQRNLKSPLSKRETEILQQVAEGKSGTRIAKELFIDAETVKSHIKNIYFKLDVNSKADAIRVARKNKFI